MSARRRRALRTLAVEAFLALGILAGILLLLGSLRLRLDLTADRLHTLAPVTRRTLAELDDRVQIKLYLNRDLEGAEDLIPARQAIEDFLAELAAASDGWISVETVDPTRDLAAARHAEHAGIVPVPRPRQGIGGVSLLNLYQGLEIRYRDRTEVLPFIIPEELEFAVVTRLRALRAGHRPRVGFFSREPPPPPPLPGVEELAASPERVFERLREILGIRYEVVEVKLDRGRDLNSELTLLIVARPEDLSPREIYELDQYLVRGGRVLLLYEHFRFQPGEGGQRIETGLDPWLGRLGVEVQPAFVWDEACFHNPVPETIEVNGVPTVRQVRMPFGFSPVLEGASLDAGHPATRSLGHLLLVFCHPVAAPRPAAGLRVDYLLHSSPRAWTLPLDISLDLSVENLRALDRQARASGPPRAFPLAAVLEGAFSSFFEAEAVPPPRLRPGQEDPSPPFQEQGEGGILVVLGDADVFSNPILQDDQNAAFAENLVDWLAQDQELLELRNRGLRLRRLPDFYREGLERAEARGVADPEEQDRIAREEARERVRRIAWGNTLAPAAGVLLLGLAWSALRGRRLRRLREGRR